MRRSLWLLLLLSACAGHVPPPPAAPAATATGPALCRVGPDGAPPADGRTLVDRGIGGTGSPRVADRGIGGTGIIGVITGFASVCLAGEEVALPPGVPATIDGRAAAITDLRAGQVAAVAASGTEGGYQARQVIVRHEVVGPVQPDATGMMVAGQRVDAAHATGTGVTAKPGQWVAVSGLHRPDGSIEATRIDLTPPGRVLLHGILADGGGSPRIGEMAVVLPPGANPVAGFPVTVTGQLVGPDLVADSVAFDPAATNPAALFGPEITSFVVETFVSAAQVGPSLDRSLTPDRLRNGAQHGSSREILRFTRGSDGRLNVNGPGSDRAGRAFGAGAAGAPGPFGPGAPGRGGVAPGPFGGQQPGGPGLGGLPSGGPIGAPGGGGPPRR